MSDEIITPVSAEATSDQELLAAEHRSARAWQRFRLRLRSITPSMLVRFLLVSAALYGIGWVCWYALDALIPFQIGIVLAYLLLPLVNRLEQRMPRTAAILLVFATSLALIVLAVAYVVPLLSEQFRALIQSLPSVEQLQAAIDRTSGLIAQLPPNVQTFVRSGISQALVTVRDNIALYVQGLINFVVTTALSLASTISFLLGFLVIPFWLFYVLKDQRQGTAALDRMLPSWMRADFWAILRIVDRVFSNYVRGQLLLCLAIGVLSFLGLNLLSLLGVDGIHATVILGIFAGLTEFIPYLGPILGAIPAVIMGLFASWQTALAIVILYVVIQQIENTFLVPKISGDSLNIHPAILVVVLVALSQFGLIWIILAGPLAAMLRDLFLYIYGRFDDPPRPAGVLPGEPIPAAEPKAIAAPQPTASRPAREG